MHHGRFEEATTYFDKVREWARRLDDRALAGVTGGLALSFSGACAYALGDLPLAATRFDEALREQQTVDDKWGIGFSLIGSAYAIRDGGDGDRALSLFIMGMTLFENLGDRRMVALALEGVAGLASMRHQPEQAAHLFAIAASVQETSGLPVEPAFRAARERGVAATRVLLGSETFAAAWAAGAAMPLDQVVSQVAALDEVQPNTDTAATPRGSAYDLKLTSREIEVLHLLAQGRSDKEIGAALFISHRTAMNHVSRIIAKLDVSSRAQAVYEATRRGLL
jgi:DNA-binding CsgD family transcriptional regulator